MTAIPAALRRLVKRRASNRCEYCGLAQRGQEATFHIDHVKSVALGGRTVSENLALACVSCSLRKGARTEGVDPSTGRGTVLFNPRTQSWDEHFRWYGVKIVGLSGGGRATVAALKLNHPRMLRIRREAKALRRQPPESW